MKDKKNLIALIFVAIALILLGFFANTASQKVGEEKRELKDSIKTLNLMLTNEHNRYVTIINAMDSISRKGGELTFTNFANQIFDVRLTPKQ